MGKRNRFHFVVTRNRKFLANGTIDVGPVISEISINVDEDHHAREAAFVVLLLGAHNLVFRDDHRAAMEEILKEYGLGKPSPIKSSIITEGQALDDLSDDIPF